MSTSNIEDEDFFIEDILLNKEKKKKVNSKDKGKRGERELCKVLSDRFKGHTAFFRVFGSGNQGWRPMTEQAKEIFTGDVVCPEGFRFSIECKYGYDHIDLCLLFEGVGKDIDKFLEQASKDAERVGKIPMLCWKKPRGAWLAFIPRVAMNTEWFSLNFRSNSQDRQTYCLLRYKEWIAVSLLDLIATSTDDFFFIPSSSSTQQC